MTEREAYVEGLKSKLDQWDAEIDKLETKVDVVSADAKAQYVEYLATLKEQRDEASSRLEELRDSSGDAWQEMRDGAERAANALTESLKSAKSKLH
ncbi:sll1863 family stress response protein [Imhoffiella purpurea]|uniref:Putative conserved coiled coil protein n=1 Tax=Imhoffiella purpurea TaxID=1249627 RepID=W9V5K3_9GAMM|nr:hypothetical protein [Imhoffiella purpurea]EXJ14803.1 Putative conserved coiled coil protein [Imhoffiella purpurea]